jgi:DNA-binding transcriptional regulator GbsR (MarR family)
MRYHSPELDELVNQIGNFIQFWGFKNVQGRIWAHLFLSEEPLDAANLMKRLDISKALVSLSVKEMLQYKVIEEVGKSERGTILYRANPNTTEVILNVLRSRERLMLSRISSAFRLCENMGEREKAKLKLSSEQLKDMKDMIQTAEGALDMLLFSSMPGGEVLQALQGAMGSDGRGP